MADLSREAHEAVREAQQALRKTVGIRREANRVIEKLNSQTRDLSSLMEEYVRHIRKESEGD